MMAQSVEALNVTRVKRSRKNREVYVIEDPKTQRTVVLKLYTADTHARRECKALSLCQGDPHFVRLLDCHAGDDYSFLITEYVEGETMAKMLVRQVPLEPRKVIELAIDVLTGLQTMHEHGIVHGDLQGRNIIVTDLDRARTKIIDLQHSVKIKKNSGKAKALRKTPQEHIMFPPEGKDGVIDQRYDIYCLGYVCACLLTGVKWDIDPPEPICALDTRPLAQPLWKIIRKAMHPDPEMRFGSAAEMIRALRNTLRGGN